MFRPAKVSWPIPRRPLCLRILPIIPRHRTRSPDRGRTSHYHWAWQRPQMICDRQSQESPLSGGSSTWMGTGEDAPACPRDRTVWRKPPIGGGCRGHRLTDIRCTRIPSWTAVGGRSWSAAVPGNSGTVEGVAPTRGPPQPLVPRIAQGYSGHRAGDITNGPRAPR